MRRVSCALALSGTLFLAVIAGAAPASHAAGFSYFCPQTYGGAVLLTSQGTSGDHCVSAHFNTLSQVLSVLSNGSGVSHCAVGKYNADGSGSNAIGAGCGTAHLVYSECKPSTVSGYAKLTNESASSHYYSGEAGWGGACFS
jgi:hypothetical protein